MNKSVFDAIKNGNMSTLNCPEEPILAKKASKMHKWAGQVKFARSGGEANAIAIRIARAYSEKTMLLFVDIMDGMIGIFLQI